MAISRRGFLRAIGATAVSGGLYSCALEPYWLDTVRVEIALRGLDPAFGGFVIAQLSDLHLGSGIPVSYLRRAVEAANAAGPDLVVVTGDIVDSGGRDGTAEEAAALLADLRPKDRVLAILGNHDTGAVHVDVPADDGSVGLLRGALREAGVDLVHNEERVIERGAARLRVTGCGDLWSGHFDGRVFRARPGEPSLVLSHNPDTAPELAERGAGLILCGHTHGGQVRLPILGPPYVPVRHKELLYGYHRLGAAQLYVNPGIGYTYGIRFNARPELTLFRLAPGDPLDARRAL